MALFSVHAAQAADTQARTAYDFSFKKLMGQKPMPLEDYRGKVLLPA